MDETLEDDIHIARSTHVVDSPNSTCTARNFNGVCRYKPGVVPRSVREELLDLSLSSYWETLSAHLIIDVSDRTRGQSNHRCYYYLLNEPNSDFRSRSSSRVGSHTKSSHIWQYKQPFLDSTSGCVRQKQFCTRSESYIFDAQSWLRVLGYFVL